MFPGNIGKSKKSLDNWRTEIPALFAFYKEDKSIGVTETSKMAIFLHENQDLPQFLRLFLLSFQFPGGHIKANEIKDLILHNVRFKPAKTIIEVLCSGNELLATQRSSKEMSLSAEEATYCIFNDLRVTSGSRTALDVAKTILENRKNKVKYYNQKDTRILSLSGKVRSVGDVTRYAGDILDYMEIAGLLVKSNGYYFLKGNETDAVSTFRNDTTWFGGYDSFYGKKDIVVNELSKIEPLWFEYVNDSMNPNLFRSSIHSVFEKNKAIEVVVDERISELIKSNDATKKDIGFLGESIVCGHEMMRLKLNGYDKYIRLVRIVDRPAYHPGFDIESYEADGTNNHRYIEVKTTISKNKIQVFGFHMSTNEWDVAETIKEHYCVYRLMLSEKESVLYVLRDPVSLYKSDKISASPRNGMEVSFSVDDFEPTELLKWKK